MDFSHLEIIKPVAKSNNKILDNPNCASYDLSSYHPTPAVNFSFSNIYLNSDFSRIIKKETSMNILGICVYFCPKNFLLVFDPQTSPCDYSFNIYNFSRRSNAFGIAGTRVNKIIRDNHLKRGIYNLEKIKIPTLGGKWGVFFKNVDKT